MSFYDGMIASVGQQLADATARLAVVRSCVRGCTGLIAELQAANHPLSAAERGLAKVRDRLSRRVVSLITFVLQDLLFAAYFRHPRELAELDVRMANLNTELIRLRRVRSFVQAATDGIWRDFQEWSTRLVDAEARYPYTGELMTVDL